MTRWLGYTRSMGTYRHGRRGIGVVANIASAIVLLNLAGCGGKSLTADQYNDPRYRGPGFGSLSSDGGTLFSTDRNRQSTADGGSATGLGVNAYLWRGTLDTLSFMPWTNADPFGGVVITDWYEPPGSNGERFKLTAYILGRQLRADAIKVAVFRQTNDGGTWIDAPVAPSTVGEIETKILARARELRAQSASR